MTCVNCGEPAGAAVCEGCMKEIASAVEQKRIDVINSAMQSLSEEADKILEADPTRGRLGRGPKWLQ